eukprot:CAMPEP_0202901696 /NCGR_PEP_ID=MMETSP1392-20130828/14408_1 /ASSEMBLY_ACC=CAM_ASM_000868 /TAXON_ID=225041 /ORGANISM="Chlamydomonas chlamydogama, Strain SAG 11-48b" /LENGTH=706 /DNA_ID=CAMNT_0049588305 /DNA_START=183 /DNA_END=2303 /DNA_ORIENTATION=+
MTGARARFFLMRLGMFVRKDAAHGPHLPVRGHATTPSSGSGSPSPPLPPPPGSSPGVPPKLSTPPKTGPAGGPAVGPVAGGSQYTAPKSKSSLVGWVVPLFGVPALYFLYMQNQYKGDNLTAEIEKVRLEIQERLKGKPPPVPKTLHQPPQKPAVEAPAAVPAAAAAAPAPATAAAAPEQAAADILKATAEVTSQAAGSPEEAAAPTAAPAADKAPAPKAAVQQSITPAPAPAPAAAAGVAAAAKKAGLTEKSAPGAASAAKPAPAPASASSAAPAAAAAAAMTAVQEQKQEHQEEKAGGYEEADVPQQLRSAVAADIAAAAVAHAKAGGYTPVLEHPSEPERPPVPKGTLGMQLDLSPAGLMRFAIERGSGPGEDWQAFASRHKQAVADAELFSRAVEQAQAHLASEVAKVQHIADAHAKRAEEISTMAQENAERFRTLLKQHQQMAAELRDLEVKQAEKRVMLKFSDAWLAERKKRHAALDELRTQLGALAFAHDARARQQAISHESHALALGIIGLTSALESGSPLAGPLAVLRAAGAHAAAAETSRAAAAPDPVVAVAVASLPAGAEKAGIPTRSALEAQFRSSTRNLVLELSYFPGSSAGMMAHAMARLAASLKADESKAVAALGPPAAAASVDCKVAAAELALSKGDLKGAADHVAAAAAGTAAEAAVAAWVEAARARAIADQALVLLRAHSSVLAASLA